MAKKGKQIHVPERTCIATRVKKPKNELIRIVCNPETKELQIDLRNKVRARGANLDMTSEAFDLMVERNLLPKALKLERKIEREEYEKLREEFIEAIEEKRFREGNKPVKIRVKREDLEKVKDS